MILGLIFIVFIIGAILYEEKFEDKIYLIFLMSLLMIPIAAVFTIIGDLCRNFERLEIKEIDTSKDIGITKHGYLFCYTKDSDIPKYINLRSVNLIDSDSKNEIEYKEYNSNFFLSPFLTEKEVLDTVVLKKGINLKIIK